MASPGLTDYNTAWKDTKMINERSLMSSKDFGEPSKIVGNDVTEKNHLNKRVRYKRNELASTKTKKDEIRRIIVLPFWSDFRNLMLSNILRQVIAIKDIESIVISNILGASLIYSLALINGFGNSYLALHLSYTLADFTLNSFGYDNLVGNNLNTYLSGKISN